MRSFAVFLKSSFNLATEDKLGEFAGGLSKIITKIKKIADERTSNEGFVLKFKADCLEEFIVYMGE